MAKTIKIGKITKEQNLTIERAARRTVDIELGIANFKSKVHKSKKSYNRKRDKNVTFD